MIPKKPVPDLIRGGNRFAAFGKPAPAGEGRSEKIVLKWKLDCGEDRHLAGLGQPSTGAVPAPLAWLAPIGEESRCQIGASIRRKPMAGTVEKKLQELGIALQEPRAPMANYVPFVRNGNMLTVSGQVCIDSEGKIVAKGQLGGGVSIEDGQKAARVCAINLLAQVKSAIGDLDKVVRVVRLGGFVNSAAGFPDGPKVMNGASDVMVAAFGDKGKHARSTVGVAALPSDAAVEVEGLFEVS
jgi:enamine deaminase RidA (YjgF/YER057c/UK114 family)